MPAKIYFSPREHALLQDQDFILTKIAVIDKVYDMLGAQVSKLQLCLSHKKLSHEEVLMQAKPKIFKGENLKGFPYVMMDYPAIYSKDDIFAIRTLFWWGHQLAVYLIVKGKYLSHVIPRREWGNFLPRDSGLHICVHSDPWRHDFEEDNLRPIQSHGTSSEYNFTKLGVKIPFSEEQNYDDALSTAYDTIASNLI